MQQAEEDLLVLAAQSGNHKAFNVLFLRYNKPLLRFAYKLSNDQEMASDAVQDAWFKSTRNLRRLNDPRAFKSWIYRLVRWQTTDLLRQKVRRKEQYDNELPEVIDESSFTCEVDDESELAVAIKKLPLIERQIIHLFYLDDMKLSEVAIILEIPVGTVKSRLTRARKLLKTKLTISGS